VRYRRSRGDERQQLKWFVSAVLLTVALFFLSWPAGIVSETLTNTFNVLSLFGWITLPLAAGIAIFRYRLYDIDLVIRKALVFGVLAAFFTAVYVAIVVGIGTLVGRAGGSSIVLSILATAVVAVAFQPVRERARRLANRLVYGHRATPYDVLAQFSEQAAATVPSEELLPQLARTVGEGTGAARSEVWVRTGDDLRLAASWPDRSAGAAPPRARGWTAAGLRNCGPSCGGPPPGRAPRCADNHECPRPHTETRRREAAQ